MSTSRILNFVLFTCSFVAISVTQASTANEMSKAQKLLSNKDYDKSFVLYQGIAKKTNEPLAQFTLALFYDYGWGRSKNQHKACQWYEKAAKNEIPAAAAALGRCLETGSLGKVNYIKAAVWYEKSAKLGLHFSLCHLGDLYINGFGVDKNVNKGIDYCKSSAAQGSIPAMLHLGEYYLADNSTQSNKSALHWFTTAASYRSAEAEYQLGLMSRDGLGLIKNRYTALNWFEKSASKGYTPAYFPTASHYFNTKNDSNTGFWSKQNLAKSYLWLSASKRSALDDQQEVMVDNMLQKILTVMPEPWLADLDKKVIDHFNKYPQKEYL
jgi:TPR repeat protein